MTQTIEQMETSLAGLVAVRANLERVKDIGPEIARRAVATSLEECDQKIARVEVEILRAVAAL